MVRDVMGGAKLNVWADGLKSSTALLVYMAVSWSPLP